ncbi:hypothetical protein AGMMS50276_20210 [Synergistales bacterium]|nr:hypothetical protein AGMMS50276_20210 [Synergistales bacterium]
MQFINFASKAPSSTFVEFFTAPDFKGESKTLGRGVYNKSAIDPASVKSVKPAPHTTVTFYENAEGPGKSKSFDGKTPDVKLDFTPSSVSVESHVKGIKDGKAADVLLQGEYDIADIKKFDKLSVPRGTYLSFYGKEKDANSILLFENEEYAIDGRIADYKKVAVFSLASDSDLSLNFKLGKDLSDEDLEAVAGGGKCGAKACGADSPCAANFSPCAVN